MTYVLLLAIPWWLFAAEPALTSDGMPRVKPTEPADVQRTIRLKPGFRMELVAAEPLVVDPIGLCFDEDGRMFVIEMRDYSERRDERLGRVRLLEDLDGDGKMDRSRIFAEGLPWPTALFWSDGGLFVASTPDVYYYADKNRDGVVEGKRVVLTGFGSGVQRLNVQQLVNNLTWGLDNRIHGATGGNWGTITCPEHPTYEPVDLRSRDFSFDVKSLKMRRETGGAQHGLSFDNFGRKFVCSNSSHLLQVMYEERYVTAAPNFSWPPAILDIPVDGGAGPVYRMSPDEPWRVIRTKWRVAGLVPGPIEGGGRPSGYFTGATGAMIYRGDALGEDFVGDAFIGDAGSNLIHRKKLRKGGVAFRAERPGDEQQVEFMASTDNWFRPVQFANAPDGGLYVLDMYREVIEHPWSLPPGIKEHLDLNSGNDRGRIYRIVAENYKQRPAAKLSGASTEELVGLLEHPNGWHRDTAARLIYERQDERAVKGLRRIAQKPESKWGRVHALWALAGLKALTWDELWPAFEDKEEGVRENALKLAELLWANGKKAERFGEDMQKLARDRSERVRYQLACTLAVIASERRSELLAVMLKHATDKWERIGIMASSSAVAAEVMEQLLLAGGQDLSAHRELAGLAGASGKPEEARRCAELVLSKWQEERAQAMLLGGLGLGLERSGKRLAEVLGKEKTGALAETMSRRLQQNREETTPEEITLLGMLEGGHSLLSQYLTANFSAEVQRAAIDAIAREKSAEAGRTVVENWGRLSPAGRQRAIEVFSGHPVLLSELLEGVKRNALQRGEFSVTQVAQLKKHGNPGVRSLALDIFGESSASARAEIIKKYEKSAALQGDLSRGKQIYTERCVSCHRVAGQGHAVGPDLETVRMAGRETVLANIVDPNREIASRYLAYEVETKDGELVSGVIATETAGQVVLRAANSFETAVARNNIVNLRNTGKSLMPEGLEEGLNEQAMADLLEFVLRGE